MTRLCKCGIIESDETFLTPLTSGTINKKIVRLHKEVTMYDMNKIMSLNADEILIVNGLQDVAKEAKEAAELIRKTYVFHIGEDKIEVWHDRDMNNFEYLTYSGVWQARYLHQTYDVECSEDEIFQYFRAEYLVDNGFVPETSECRYTEEGQMKSISKYFRRFLKDTRSLYESQQTK